MRFENFNAEREKLKSLLGEDLVEARCETLETIFKVTEACWDDNLEYIKEKNIKIKYLLIAEAPPWNKVENEEPEKGIVYFYNSKDYDKDQSYLRNVFKGLFPEERDNWVKPSSIEEKRQYLKKIADKGFILIDSLPFSMKYPSAKRDEKDYKDLIEVCSENYLNHKLNYCGIPWSDDGFVWVAFSLWKNGRAVIKHLRRKLPFSSNLVDEFQEKPVWRDSNREDPYAVVGSGMPDYEQLNRIFKLG